MKVKFAVYGEPKGKGRPRFFKVGKRTGTYTPHDTVEYENLVRAEYRSQCGSVKFGEGEMLEMRIFAYYAIPKSISRKKHIQMLDKTIRPTKKPDADNIIKIIADSLNKTAYYDDKQIVDIVVRKYYSDNPRVEVMIQNIGGIKNAEK